MFVKREWDFIYSTREDDVQQRGDANGPSVGFLSDGLGLSK